MNLLVFDPKKSLKHQKTVPVALKQEELAELLKNHKPEAFLIGGLVQIFDHQVAEILHEMAGIGEFLNDEREESCSVSRTCFRMENGEIDVGRANNWKAISPPNPSLVLSVEETVLLAADWQLMTLKNCKIFLNSEETFEKMRELSGSPANFGKSYAVYRFLRQNGWIVRSGMTFGCDFLIYALGVQYYHSSAGVVISDKIDPLRLLTLTRILSHNKKALVLATTCAVNSEDVKNLKDVKKKVEVKVVTMKTYFLERDVAGFSNKRNELYNVIKEN